MALIGANELKRKLLISVEGQPYVVLDVFLLRPQRVAMRPWCERVCVIC